jgi:hypothetical protein
VVSIDLGEVGVLSDLQRFTIDVPAGASGLAWEVSVYQSLGTYPHKIILDRDPGTGLPSTRITTYLPTQPVSGFDVRIREEFEEPSWHAQTNLTSGAIPTAFEALPGELWTTSVAPASAGYVWTGEAARHTARWVALVIGSQEWHISGPATGDVRLPQLPPELLALNPGLTREVFRLEEIELTVESDPYRTRVAWWRVPALAAK